MSVHSGCVHNELRSLEGRVLRPTYEMDPAATKLLSSVARAWGSSLPCLPFFPMDGQLFLFPRHRRTAYLKGLQSLLQSPISENDAFISAFVKCEKIDVLGKDGDPRMIQARSIRWNLELGRFTRKIEKQLYQLKDKHGLPLLAKGRNPTQRASDLRAKWECLHNPVALCLDLSRWDMHVRAGLLRAVFGFYQQVMPSEQLAWLTAHMVVNKGRTTNGLKYKRADGVTSGDMTTALGNCLAVCIMLASLRELRTRVTTGRGLLLGKRNVGAGVSLRDWRSLVGHLEMTKHDFVEYDDGDDHTFMCEAEDAPHYQQAIEIWYRLCGHKLTVEGFTSKFEEITFCQSKPIYVGDRWIMASDPKKTLCTAFMVPPQALGSEKSARKYLSEMFLGRSIVHAGEPYIGPMFQRLSNEYKADYSVLNTPQFRMNFTGLWLRSNLLSDEQWVRSYVRQRNNAITSETRQRYCEAWGIEHEIIDQLSSEPLPPLGGPKRSTFYYGNPIDLGIDTLTEWGIVTKNTI